MDGCHIEDLLSVTQRQRMRAGPTRERGRLARISTSHNLPHLLHPPRPANTPRLCFAQAHAVHAIGVGGCHIEDLLSVMQRQRMRAGRPRSRVVVNCAEIGHLVEYD